ncbi:MAG: ABC transporter substrate-binding protein [Myxococcota bacterium]
MMRPMLVLAVLLPASCSLSDLEHQPCRSAVSCREVFGARSTCGAEGFCTDLETPARCEETYPVDLLAQPDIEEWLLLGSAFDVGTSEGAGRERSVEVAVRIVNEAGGVDGRRVGLVKCNSERDPERFPESDVPPLNEMSDYFVNLGIQVIVGGDASTSPRELASLVLDQGIVFVTPEPGDPWLDTLDSNEGTEQNPGRLWSTVPSVQHQGFAIAKVLEESLEPPSQVTIIADATDYGASVKDQFSKRFVGAPPTEFTVDVAETENLRNVIKTVAASGAEVVIYAGERRVAQFLELAAEQPDFEAKALVLTEAGAHSEVLNDKVVGRDRLYPMTQGVRSAIAEPSRNPYVRFQQAYENTFGVPIVEDLGFAASYDAAWLAMSALAYAASQGGDRAGDAIAIGLRQLSAGERFETVAPDWPLAQARLLQGQSIDLVGASGELDFDTSEQLEPRVEAWDIEEQPSNDPRFRVRVLGVVL